ncbi:cutinase [Mycobacterium alsense]|uniref:Cutinase n=2 Tax=Mycobacterium alsense TaxID=324058 RepID=A0ABD6NYC2_9MYCO|nr:cutinase [Mycobacterium alsense]
MALAVAFLAVAAYFVVPKLMPLASASCPDVEVVFARGTDEPPGVGRVGQAFVNSLRQHTRKSVGAYGVSYPASKDFLAAADGANDASNHVQRMANNCPNSKVVLGGYSQGAAVIDIVTAAPLPGFGFRQPLPAKAADHVAAVALFGNPSARAGGLMSALTPDFSGKTIDLCNAGDPICSNGNKWSAHLGYVPGLTNQAAAFVAGRV